MALTAEKRPFSSFNDAASLAEYLNVPPKALFCVDLEKDTLCGVPECLYPAIARNRPKGRNSGPRCCLHHNRWFPREPARGHYLIDSSYLRSRDGNKLCCCENKFCLGIGYSSSMIRIPKKHRRLAVTALGASGDFAALLSNKEKDVRLAPWHFHPQHRIKKTDGRWVLVHFHDDDVFYDHENKRWVGFPPPNYSPKDYYEIEIHAGGGRTRPQDRWHQTSLPPWVQSYIKTERVTTTLHPKRRPLADLVLPSTLRQAKQQSRSELELSAAIGKLSTELGSA